jgi:predicted enzyme related to lactoylglutathione lyase
MTTTQSTKSTKSSKSSKSSKSASKSARTSNANAIPQGTFVWFELRTPDAKAAQKFYADVVGWNASEMSIPGGPATTLLGPGAETALHIELLDKSARAQFVSYVHVDDVDACATRVAKAGGTVHGAPFDVPTIGRMVEVSDPDGARFFLFHSATGEAAQPKGPGGILWNELVAKNAQTSLAFLTSVLGYRVETMPMPTGPYHVLKDNAGGAQSLGGVMQSLDPSAKSAQFLPYIHVLDVDKALARATKLGATVVFEPQEVDGVGRFAAIVDPQGALVALMTPAQ